MHCMWVRMQMLAAQWLPCIRLAEETIENLVGMDICTCRCRSLLCREFVHPSLPMFEMVSHS